MSAHPDPDKPLRLLLTPGEPAGIGPDVLLQWFVSATETARQPIIAVADPELLSARAGQLGLTIKLHVLEDIASLRASGNALCVIPCRLAQAVKAGRPDASNANYVLDCLRTATDLCLSGQADALITGPVQKSIINEAGISFSGHTEFLAERSAPAGEYIEPVMMLATAGLRVALVTTHLPLRDVPSHITPAKLRYCLNVLHASLQRDFGIQRPRILVAGLNPHAGEDGHLGSEELEIINPVLEDLRSQGMQLQGPLPADTLFTPKYLAQADAVLAMYHDQGLPVLKHLGFSRAVNITLGLPLIRTSVDHGTALDLAGSGQADSGSLAYAIEVARQLAHARHSQRAARP